MKLLVVLTQYKRSHLENQLKQIDNQTIKPDYVVVFQNENHIDISHLKSTYNFIHIKSDYNTKYFGRFAACFTFPVDICMVFDDDIIPGTNCIQNYVEQCVNLNAIIGGNGRIGYNNQHKLRRPRDVGKRQDATLVDFVGHLWCFKKEWLHYMFGIEPFTYDTGEDMHFCYSAKLLGNVNSFVGKQLQQCDECDITNNSLASDNVASHKTTTNDFRKSVEDHFLRKYDLKLITHN